MDNGLLQYFSMRMSAKDKENYNLMDKYFNMTDQNYNTKGQLQQQGLQHEYYNKKEGQELSRPLLRLLYGDIGFVYPACLWW